MSDCTGTTRFPPLAPTYDNLSEAQQIQYDYLLNITKAVYGDTIVTENADGSLAGPFNELLYTPTLVQPWVNIQLAIAGLLIPIEAEAAVLGVLSVTKARYGIYAHTILAQKAGYTSTQVVAMLAGTCPIDITLRAQAIYKLAIELAQTRGPLDSASYDAAFSALGQAGVNGAIHQAAGFMYASIMLNAGDVCLPANVDP